MRIHYISFMTSTLHILHGGCVTRASRMHCIYFIEHMWHIPTDVYTTHKSSFMWIHQIYTMVYTQHMHHGGRVMHTWSCICRAISRSQLCNSGPMRISPSRGAKTQVVLQKHEKQKYYQVCTYIVVVFPAPLCPRNDVICPSYKFKLNLFTASFPVL